MISVIKQKWQSLPSNDQRIYALLGAAITLLLIYTFIWLPSQQARVRLERVNQEKKSQLARMQIQLEQVKTLQSAIQLSHSNQQGLQAAIEASAKLHNIRSAIAKIEANGSGAIQISLPSVDFNAWITWIAALQSEHHIRVASCDVVRTPQGVNVVASLVAE